IYAKTFPQTRNHLRHRNRIRAQRKDVLVDADPFDVQKVRPDPDHLPLHVRAGRSHPAAAFHPHCGRGREFATLDLSARAFRNLLDNSDEAGDLEAGEALASKVSELLGADMSIRTQYDDGGDVHAKSAMGGGENGSFDHVWVAQ